MNTAANQPASHQSRDHFGETKISTCAVLPPKKQIPDPLLFSLDIEGNLAHRPIKMKTPPEKIQTIVAELIDKSPLADEPDCVFTSPAEAVNALMKSGGSPLALKMWCYGQWVILASIAKRTGRMQQDTSTAEEKMELSAMTQRLADWELIHPTWFAQLNQKDLFDSPLAEIEQALTTAPSAGLQCFIHGVLTVRRAIHELISDPLPPNDQVAG